MGNPLQQTGDHYGTSGASLELNLSLQGARPYRTARVTRVDSMHGNLSREYQDIGSPEYPTREQIEELKHRAALPDSETLRIHNGKLTLAVPPNGIALLELS
jgi:xylan 1,4-beta-xylosidase